MTIHHKIWNLIRGGSFRGYLRTVSGYPLTLTGCMPEYPVSLTVAGNTVQDGTPTPDNPVEVQGVGDRTANLFNKDKYIQGITVNLSAKAFNNVSPYSGYMRVYYIQAKPNTTYYFNKNIGNYLCIVTCSGIPKVGMSITNISTTGIVTTSETDKYIAIYPLYISEVQNGLTYDEVEKSIMVTEGTEPLSYGYKIPMTVSGKNLADMKNVIDGYASGRPYPYMTDDGYILTSGEYTRISKLNCKLKAGVTYVADFRYERISGTENPRIYLPETSQYLSKGKKFIPKEDVKKIGIYFNDKGEATNQCKITEVMVTEGTEAVPYEPYHEPQTFPIYTDAPIYGNGTISDTVELDVRNRHAVRNKRVSVDESGNITQLATPVTTDISDMQDWDSIPKLWRGTAILTADTTIQPSGLTVKYYADKPGEEVS